MDTNNSLLKSMKTVAEGVVSSATFDMTRNVIIDLNNNDGTYSILLDGITYTNVPAYGGNKTLTKGTIVKIVMPCNQTSQMFILSPTSEGGGGGFENWEITETNGGNLNDIYTPDDQACISRYVGGEGVTFGANAESDGFICEWDTTLKDDVFLGLPNVTITDTGTDITISGTAGETNYDLAVAMKAVFSYTDMKDILGL